MSDGVKFVRCVHAVTGQESEIAEGAVEAFKSLGWEPISDPRTLEEIHTANYHAEIAAERAAVEAAEVAEEVPDLTVKQVLDEVGDDRDKAVAAFQAEEVGKARTTLLAALQKVIDSADDADPPVDPVTAENPDADGAGNTEAGTPGETEGN